MSAWAIHGCRGPTLRGALAPALSALVALLLCVGIDGLASRLPAAVAGQGLMFIGPLSALLLVASPRGRPGSPVVARWRGLAAVVAVGLAPILGCLVFVDLAAVDTRWAVHGVGSPGFWGGLFTSGALSAVALLLVRRLWFGWRRLRRRRLLFSVLHVQLVAALLLVALPYAAVSIARSDVSAIVAGVAASCDGPLAAAVGTAIVGVLPLGAFLTAALGVALVAMALPLAVVAHVVTRHLEARTRAWATGLHELRTPVAVMRCHLDRPKGPATLTATRREVDRLQGLLDDLGPLGQDVLAPAEDCAVVDLQRWCQDWVRHWSAVAWRLARVELSFRGDGVARARCHLPHLEQALGNLAWNALRHTPAGGAIRVSLRALGHGVAVEVHDTGPGVAPELTERLFEPGVAGKDGGSGLGLTVARQLVRAMDGDLELVRAPGSGACFRVLLPRA